MPALAKRLARWCAEQRASSAQTMVVGVAGAQGSGKSTLCRQMVDELGRLGCASLAVSVDDLYLARRARECLAKTVHPLFLTRGVPATHDVVGGIELLSRARSCKQADELIVPRFDKASDDLLEASDWERHSGPFDVLLFEGWCVGATPQAEADLDPPQNELERDEDPHGIWRRHVNRCLAGAYRRLFAELDATVFLQAPSFDVVYQWRKQQELETRSRAVLEERDDAALSRFILHFERLTRHMLSSVPLRADCTVVLDDARRVVDVAQNAEPRRAE